MILVIGGRAQGKLEYVLEHTKFSESDLATDFAPAHTSRIFYRMHEAVRETLGGGGNPLDELTRLMDANPGIVIICDEVGGGVVPIDPFEREWRETVGRLCFEAAQRADIVERIFCGLPMRLKGDGEWSLS